MQMQLGQNLGQRLEQRMSQKQIQSLDILAMPVAELHERIADELTENPALECATDMQMFRPGQSNGKNAAQDRYDWQKERYLPREHTASFLDSGDTFQNFLENIPAVQSDVLHNHLLEQLYFQTLDDETFRYAKRIIENLTPDGFHALPLAVLFKKELSAKYSSVYKKIRRALSLVRCFDPIGCAVRDFKQSLCIQANILFRDKGKIDPIYTYTIDILEHHFHFLEKARAYSLVNAVNGDDSIPYKITQENAENILTLIASLNPFPGKEISADRTGSDYITPTAFIECNNREFTVTMNDYELPLLTVSPEFRKLEQYADDTETKTYIKEHLHRARDFIGSLNQREKTILSVLQKIVSVQEAFFLSGDPRLLVPLTQQQLAESLGIHESTVSRTVSGKYIQCPWGIFEMKYFFTASLPTQPKQTAALYQPNTKEGVKTCIRELLETQSGKLSDQKISDMLAERYGVSVARRTVAKYRKELAIASSYDRR